MWEWEIQKLDGVALAVSLDMGGGGGSKRRGLEDEGTAFGRKAGKLGLVIFHC